MSDPTTNQSKAAFISLLVWLILKGLVTDTSYLKFVVYLLICSLVHSLLFLCFILHCRKTDFLKLHYPDTHVSCHSAEFCQRNGEMSGYFFPLFPQSSAFGQWHCLLVSTSSYLQLPDSGNTSSPSPLPPRDNASGARCKQLVSTLCVEDF